MPCADALAALHTKHQSAAQVMSICLSLDLPVFQQTPKMVCAGTLAAWQGLQSLHYLAFAGGALAGQLPAEWPDLMPNLAYLYLDGVSINSTLPASE